MAEICVSSPFFRKVVDKNVIGEWNGRVYENKVMSRG